MKISRQNGQISTHIWPTKIDTRGYKNLNRQKKVIRLMVKTNK